MSSRRANPGSQSSLREANRSRIVDAVSRHGGLTQVELAAATGLSAATVSNIVKELCSAGLLHTTPTSRSGHRALHVTLARAAGLVVGLQITTGHLRGALADTGGQLVAERSVRLTGDLGPDHDLDLAAQLVAGMVGSVDADLDEVLAIGVGIPAPIDPGTGAVSTPGLLRGWDDVRVAEELGARVHGAVHVDNEANLGALAELRMGAARGADQAAYIRVSHGVGAGLIVDGHVHRGSSGKAGEIGHTRIDEDGPLCRCGNRGCLETFIGEAALVGNLGPGHGGVGIRDIVVMAATGDARARRVIAAAGRRLGIAAANLSNLVDPDLIVIGGELAEAGEILLTPMRQALERAALQTPAGTPEVVTSELGDRAEALGAVLFAIDSAQLGSLAGQSGAILAS